MVDMVDIVDIDDIRRMNTKHTSERASRQASHERHTSVGHGSRQTSHKRRISGINCKVQIHKHNISRQISVMYNAIKQPNDVRYQI